MNQDHYATLGVTPTADAAVIRAAYLALMREYHPDKNPNPAAVERAQAIIAAFTVLGDFDRRSHYDWDRRRDREKAAALAAKRPRRIRAGAVAAGAIGLAAVGAWVLIPAPTPEPMTMPVPVTAGLPAAEVRDVPVTKTKPGVRRVAVAAPARVKVEKREPALKVEPRAQLVRVAKAEPVRPKPKVERAPVVRVVAVKALAPRVAAPPAPPPQAKVAVKPVRQAARPATDLASLDQFVMNFYGQSWRYGDTPKRAALVQSRDKFVARRGECAADACKRAAYLKLMRDVSEIVETGQPRTR